MSDAEDQTSAASSTESERVPQEPIEAKHQLDKSSPAVEPNVTDVGPPTETTSNGRPVAPQQPGPSEVAPASSSDRRFQTIMATVAVLGLVLAAGTLLLQLQTRDAEAEAVGAIEASKEAERAQSFEVVYWIGPRADVLLREPDPYSLMLDEFRGVGIVESSGDWLSPLDISVDPDQFDCESEKCANLTDEELEQQLRTLWLLLFNTDEETMQSVAISWTANTTRPVEAAEPFAAVRSTDLDGPTTSERLADLSPGSGLIMPIATVVRIDAFGQIRSVPIGQARIATELSYSLAGEDTSRSAPIREPSETLISAGYDQTGLERIGIGG